MVKQRIIGLTGGIATGKTTVSQYLEKKYQLPIFDADIYAREAVKIGSPILENIINRYSQDILLPDGNLNRAKLGEIVFKNDLERQWLEAQIHPFVRKQLLAAVQANHGKTIVLVIPLLFESNLTKLVTEVWVVNCSEDLQLERLMERNQLTMSQAKSRITSQIPLSEKVKQANIVLENQFNREKLYQQIDLAIAGQKPSPSPEENLQD